MLARTFYGWRERCRLRELRYISSESRELRRRLLHSARHRLWRWRLARVLCCWCDATRLLSWGRLRLARAVDRLGMLRLHWAMAAWHAAAGCSAAESEAVERIGGAERAVKHVLFRALCFAVVVRSDTCSPATNVNHSFPAPQVQVVTKLQSLLYPPPPTPADVADAERIVAESFQRLAKQRCALLH